MIESAPYQENIQRGSQDFPFEYYKIDKDHERFVMDFHYHADQEIITVASGGLSISLNEKNYHLTPGEYLFVGAGVVHGGHPDNADTVYECLCFNFSQIFELERTQYCDIKKIVTYQLVPEEFYSKEKDEKLVLDFEALFASVRKQTAARSLTSIGCLLMFLSDMIVGGRYLEYQTVMASRYIRHLNKSQALFRYIYDHYRSDITLEDMAGAVGLSPKYFCKFFKELTGSRPMDYLNRFRIDSAAIRLANSSDSVNQIAYACGFRDPCYFTKLFKRYKQVSPREFREKRL